MKKAAALAVVGGDLRQGSLARLLREDGHKVSVFALERQEFENGIEIIHDPRTAFACAGAVILPMPVLQDEKHLNAPLSNAPHRIETILDCIPSGTLVLGGSVTNSVQERASRAQLQIKDYLTREELAIRNAVPTAEGAIQIAMEELPITIHRAKALVIGNGRIGKLLSQKLACLGADVTVSARSNADFARIEAAGLHMLDTRLLAGHIANFDVVFNTVPVRVLGLAELAELRADCLVIDLASKPGGADEVFG